VRVVAGLDVRVECCHVPGEMKTLLILPVIALPILHAAEPTVTLAGVQVVMDDGEKDFDGFKTFNMEKGHNVALIVRSKGKTMVGFDEDKASITLGGAKTDCSFFSNMGFSKDRLSMKLEFNTSDPVLTDEQGRFKVEGGLPIVLATGKDEVRGVPFAVKVGAAVGFPEGTKGMPKLKVKSIGKPDFGDAEFEIEFSTNMQMDEFAGVRFYTKDGKPVEAEKGGSSWMGFNGRGSGEFSYQFKAKQSDLILAVETWSGKEEITLKVDLSAGLVLPK
jgi:hypothetical protein